MDQSTFAKLAPELRNQIWEPCVTAPSSIKIKDIANSDHLNITRTCRQIRAETLLMLYGTNTFELRIDSGDLDRYGNRRPSSDGLNLNAGEANHYRRQELRSAIKWLGSKAEGYPARIARLEIVLLSNHKHYGGDLENCRKEYKELLCEVEAYGYKAPRLRVVGGVHKNMFPS
jgi:hypothetical protein